MGKANLSDRDHALYAKLFASKQDIAIARSCASYIRKKGWHTASYLRRGSVRIQQIAFTTTMIVAYARPFATGSGNIALPKRIIEYGSEQKKLHEQILRLRHKEYAHTDASTYKITPYKGEVYTDIVNIRDVCFSDREIDSFLLMTSGLQSRITERMEQLRLHG